MRRVHSLSLIVLTSAAIVSCDSGGGDFKLDLPVVFAYGDSIRGGYEPWLRRLLSEEAEVWTTGTVNGMGSVEMLAALEDLPLSDTSNLIPGLDDFEVVCINAGIWDGSRFDSNFIPTTNDQYQENFINALNLIFERNPSAQVVLVTSTPPNPEFPNAATNNPRIIGYNSVLRELSNVYSQVSICDLYEFVVENADDSVYDGGVHFTRDFSRELAGEVYFALHSALARASQN